MTWTSLTGLLLSLPMLAACGPQYHYAKTVDPSTFARPGCRAILEPVHSEALIVGAIPEAQYLADKSADSGASYDKDKADSLAEFHQRVVDAHAPIFAAGGSPENTFIIRPLWTHWDPGYYAYFASAPGQAALTVDVLTAAGQPLEEFYVKGLGAGFSSGGRMRDAFKLAAKIVNSYVNDKWSCARP